MWETLGALEISVDTLSIASRSWANLIFFSFCFHFLRNLWIFLARSILDTYNFSVIIHKQPLYSYYKFSISNKKGKRQIKSNTVWVIDEKIYAFKVADINTYTESLLVSFLNIFFPPSFCSFTFFYLSPMTHQVSLLVFPQ